MKPLLPPLLLGALLAAPSPPVGGHPPLRERLDSVASAYHARNAFDGVILVAHRDSVVYRAAFGAVDRPGRTPIGAGDRFPICSITKQFTALLVMRQVGLGRLALDERIGRYLPELDRDAAGDVTLRWLLTHTSGLPNLDEVEPMVGEVAGFYSPTRPEPGSARDVAARYARRAPGDTARAGFRYNNLDFVVLQAALEAVTGVPFATLLEREVLRPLGMKGSGMVTARIERSLVPAYDSGAAGVAASSGWLLSRYAAAGAMYSTADDLLRWDRALLTHRLLDSAATREMFAADPATGFVALGSYTYPIERPGGGTVLVVDRQGNIGAWQTENVLVPEEGWSVIVLANIGHAALGAPYRGEGLVLDLLRAVLAAR